MDTKKALMFFGGERYINQLMKGLKLEITGDTYDGAYDADLTVAPQVIWISQPQLRLLETRDDWQLWLDTPIALISEEGHVLYPVKLFSPASVIDGVENNKLWFSYRVTTDVIYDKENSPEYDIECYVSPIAQV